MASNVQICNLALHRLGAQPITTIVAPFNNELERKLGSMFPLLRDLEQGAYPWAFCRQRVQLAQSTSTPVFGWSYAYQLPTDFVGNPKTSDNSNFKIEGDLLLSDQSSLYLSYTAVITDPTKFSAEFIELLVARIALELSYNLTDSASLTATMFEMYKKAQIEARNRAAMSSGTPDTTLETANDFSWINAART
jgi:hypothetical protein